MFREWIRKLMALPLLPEEEIHQVYVSLELPTSEIEGSTKELIKQFRTYLNRTWIYGNINLSVLYYEYATNNAAESLKSYIKTPHPNIWKFMTYLNNTIKDYNIEFQRLMENNEITRGPSSCTKVKRTKRNECKEKYLNGSYNAVEYLDAISLTIGREHFNSNIMSTAESDITTENVPIEDQVNLDQCHVCLLPRESNFALLHNDYIHGGFCEAKQLLEMGANCPICRYKISGILRIYQ